MADDVLDSWEDATDIGEFEKRMDQREKDILRQEELQKQALANSLQYNSISLQEETGKSEYVPQIKILKRQNGPGQQKNQQKTTKPTKTLAEKEADYAAARARIMGDYSNSNQEEDSKKVILSSETTTSNGKISSPSTRTDSPSNNKTKR